MARANLKTPAGDAGVMVTKTVDDQGNVTLKFQNNISSQWFEVLFEPQEFLLLTYDANYLSDGK